MNIVSWNLWKIGVGRSDDATAIAKEFIPHRATPFVFFVLGSTGTVRDARKLGDRLADAMGAGSTLPTVDVVDVGGSGARKENVLALSRGVTNPMLSTLDG